MATLSWLCFFKIVEGVLDELFDVGNAAPDDLTEVTNGLGLAIGHQKHKLAVPCHRTRTPSVLCLVWIRQGDGLLS